MMRCASTTNAGPKQHNEDCLAFHLPQDPTTDSKGCVAVIADGVSAAIGGGEASHIAVNGFLSDYLSTPDTWQVKTAANRVLSSLNRWLYASGTHLRDETKGHLTTFTAVIVKSRTAHVFHIGDSRLYVSNKTYLEQVTRDHANSDRTGHHYLTRALGLSTNPRIDYHRIALEEGQTLVLTTDGIHQHVQEAAFTKIYTQHRSDPDALAEALDAEAANNGSDDNRSVLALQIDSLPSGTRDEALHTSGHLPFPPDLDPGMILDGLKIEKLLRASARSELYLVRDSISGKRLVMKTPSRNFMDDSAYIERFMLEEWIGQRIQNPYLVTTVARPEKSCLYVLMEYVDGINLAEWIRQHPRPEVTQVIRITRQIAEGTRALHRAETLHQDLKPDNIVLDGQGRARIVDYGSCRIAGIQESHSINSPQDILGTLEYTAPEYRIGRNPDPRADQFSLAAITYALLSGGAHPYPKGWEKAASIEQFISLSYSPVYTHSPLVPAWLDAALKKALSPRPEARYDALSEFLHDLEYPNPGFLKSQRDLPLVERNPVLAWKLISLALLIALILAVIF